VRLFPTSKTNVILGSCIIQYFSVNHQQISVHAIREHLICSGQ